MLTFAQKISRFSYVLAASAPIHAFLEFFLTGSPHNIQSPWLLSHMTIGERMDRRINSVAMTIINPQKKILAQTGIEPAIFCK